MSLCVRGADVAVGFVSGRRRGDGPARGVVLYYHAVRADQRGSFARQMDALVATTHPFRADAPQTMRRGVANAAVTFDDGFRSVVDHALPELSARGIPVMLFVPTGCLGERPSWIRDPRHASWDERVLSAAELRDVARRPQVALGAHSVTHRDLLTLAPLEAEDELVRSKADLESATGLKVEAFSFPHGAHSASLIAMARRAGYRFVFTIDPATVHAGRGDVIGRVGVDPGDWPIEFRLKLAGAYRWRLALHRLRMAG